VPVEPVTPESLSLRAYAAVKAALAEGFSLGEVLALEGIDPEPWARADLGWTERLAEGGAPLDAYRADLAAAEDRLARRVDPLDDDLGAWLAFLDAYLGAPAPDAWLQPHGLGLNDLSRLGRRWKQRMDGDPSIEKSVERLRKRGVGALPALHVAPARLVRSRMGATGAPPLSPTAAANLPEATGDDGELAAPRDVPSFLLAPASLAPARLPAAAPASETVEVSADVMAALAALPLPFRKAASDAPTSAAPASLAPARLPATAPVTETAAVSADMMAQLAALPLPFHDGPSSARLVPSMRPAPPVPPTPPAPVSGTVEVSAEIMAQLAALPLPFQPSAAVALSVGPVCTATVAWRARGVRYLTTVVKTTFALVSEGRMRLVTPERIARGEALDASGVGLQAADDLAPYLAQPEVWLIGHAAVPPGTAQPSLRVRLAVFQAGAVVVDKQLDLAVAGALADPPRVRIAGMGPIAADWPLRSRWLEGLDRRGLTGPVLDVPDGLHWEYFQSSPRDQRLAPLQGDEWLLLAGMLPGQPALRTQLPAAQAVARLYRRAHAPPRTGEPIALRADTVQIDVDRQRCSILWRGRAQLPEDAELPSLGVAAGLETAGQAVAWSDPFSR
jgi:hypothetical protein